MIQEYEITIEELQALIEACKPVPYMIVGGVVPRSPQENANIAWGNLGRKYGFKWDTVSPITGKGQTFFTAVPTQPEGVKE